MENNSVIGKITEGFLESTRSAHAISKENFAIAKEESKARHEGAGAPHPGMTDFKEARSLGGKAKAAFKGMEEEAERQKETTTQFQDDAIHLRGTRNVLSAQREFSEAVKASIPGKAR